MARDSGVCGDLELDNHFVGASRTKSLNSLVTDSAAGATAYATGLRTWNHVVAEVPVEERNMEHMHTGEGMGNMNHSSKGKQSHLKPVGTILEGAQLAGMRTGIVTTTRVTHATPASFSSHVADREDENEIAREQVISLELNVLLGGGLSRFVNSSVVGSTRDDTLDLLMIAGNRGYEIAFDANELQERVETLTTTGTTSSPSTPNPHPFVHTKNGPRLLGLFSDSHLPYEIDVHGGLKAFNNSQTPHNDTSHETPSLAQMLDAALKTLDAKWSDTDTINDNGFILVVEAGRIDHASHANDASAVLGEVCAYDRAFQRAIEYALERDDTLVVATSDHDTGGLSVGCCDEYGMHVDRVVEVTQSAEFVASQIVSRIFSEIGSDAEALNSSSAVASVTAIVVDSLTNANRDPNDETSKISSEDISTLVTSAINASLTGESATHSYEGYELQNKLGEVMNAPNLIGWTSHAHTGVDVPVFAFGAQSHSFHGSHANFQIGRAMIDLMDVDPEHGYMVFRDRLGLVNPSFDEPDR